MRTTPLIIFVLCILFSGNCLAQSIYLTEGAKKSRIDIFLMPGISPDGARLFQFSFIKFEKFNETINSHNVTLFTASDKILYLSNPVKDTSYQTSKFAKGWYSSFVLSPTEIAILKSAKISRLVIEVNNKPRTINILPSKSIEIYNQVTKFF
jgi:hypothetical protein